MAWNPIEIEFVACARYYARAKKRWEGGDHSDPGGLLAAWLQMRYRESLIARMAFYRLTGQRFAFNWQPNDDDWGEG